MEEWSGFEDSSLEASPSYSALDNGQELPNYFISTDTFYLKHKMNMFDYVGKLSFKSSYAITKPKGLESMYRIYLSLRGVQLKFGINTTLLEINQIPVTTGTTGTSTEGQLGGNNGGSCSILFDILLLEATKIYLNENEQVEAKLEKFDGEVTSFQLTITLIKDTNTTYHTTRYIIRSIKISEGGVAIWSIVPKTNLSLIVCKFFAPLSTASYSAEVCFFNNRSLILNSQLNSKLLFQIFMGTIALITLHPSCQHSVAEYVVPNDLDLSYTL